MNPRAAMILQTMTRAVAIAVKLQQLMPSCSALEHWRIVADKEDLTVDPTGFLAMPYTPRVSHAQMWILELAGLSQTPAEAAWTNSTSSPVQDCYLYAHKGLANWQCNPVTAIRRIQYGATAPPPMLKSKGYTIVCTLIQA